MNVIGTLMYDFCISHTLQMHRRRQELCLVVLAFSTSRVSTALFSALWKCCSLFHGQIDEAVIPCLLFSYIALRHQAASCGELHK